MESGDVGIVQGESDSEAESAEEQVVLRKGKGKEEDL